MALIDFLYRCPLCGADPLTGEGERGQCTSGCGRIFRRSRDGSAVVVTAAGEERVMSFPELDRALEARSGVSGGDPQREAAVHVRIARDEEPVHYRGRLLGFFERLGPEVRGRLALEGDLLRFDPSEAGPPVVWPLARIRAVQTSSSALQISPDEGGIVTLRFPSDSSRRWEGLVIEALRRLWRETGKGEIVEFQPRIRGA